MVVTKLMWKVEEDATNGTTLYVYDSEGAAIYASAHYERSPCRLLKDLASLAAGSDPRSWHGHRNRIL